MLNTLRNARRLCPAGAGAAARQTPTSSANLFRRVVDGGELIVLPGALQELGLFDEVVGALRRNIELNASAAARSAIDRAGLSQLHHHLDGPRVERIWSATTAEMSPRTTELGARIGRELFGFDGCYVARRFWLRMYLPERYRRDNEALFSLRAGFLQGTRPHRDSVFTAATNSIVIWAALGPVRAGNSMILYPEQWRRPLPLSDYEARGLRPPSSLPLGTPTTVALDPGDILLFSGEHLHSSEVNSTEETRVSMTLRLTPSAPRYGQGGRWIPYVDTRLANSHLAFAATARARCSRAYLQHVLIRRGLWEAKVAAHRALPTWVPDPHRVLVERRLRGEQKPPPPLVVELDERAIAEGSFSGISSAQCAVRAKGRLYVVARHCPHCGSDLSVNGHLTGASVICGADHLRFELGTGRCSAAGAPTLQVYQPEGAADGRTLVRRHSAS